MNAVDGEDGQGDVEMGVLEIERAATAFQLAAEIEAGFFLAQTVLSERPNGAVHHVFGRTTLVEEIAAEEDEVDAALPTHAQNLLQRVQRVLGAQRILAAEAQMKVGREEDFEHVLRTALWLSHFRYGWSFCLCGIKIDPPISGNKTWVNEHGSKQGKREAHIGKHTSLSKTLFTTIIHCNLHVKT